jgi:hypothetical protein
MSGQVFNKAHLFEDFRFIISKYKHKKNESTTGSNRLVITGRGGISLLPRGVGRIGTYIVQRKSFYKLKLHI